jgi:prolipoprotein diacylglyceryltransferase
VRPIVVDLLARILPYDVAATIAPGWFTMVGLAGLVTLFWMMRIARRNAIDPGVVASAVLWCYVAAVAAGIAMPMLIDAIEQKLATGAIHLRWAGMTSFWGYLAGTGAVIVVCRDHGVPLARFADLCVAPLGIALALARTGCFLAGCDYGKVSALPWALRFPAGSPAWHDQIAAGLLPGSRAASLPVHPTELYEAVLGVVICAVGVIGIRRVRRDGNLFLGAVAVYCFGRIGIETLRGDIGRGIYGELSSGQIFSLLVLGALAARVTLARVKVARIAMAAATVVIVIGGARVADAQPAKKDGKAQPKQQQPQPAADAEEHHRPGRFAVGVLGGGAIPLNRHNGQVPPLAGYTLSLGIVFPVAGVWLDFDSYGNSDASHGTLLASGSFTKEAGGGVVLGGRAGVGATLVNFKDPVFRDATGTDFRVEATAEYPLGTSFVLWARPLSFDVLTATSLGGPIMTWQVRFGIAYQTAKHDKPRASTTQARNP